MKLSPALTGLRTYPFVRLDEAKRSSRADGVDLIDFGVGEPREETPAFIREALVAALEPLSTYPVGARAARAARGDRRAGRGGRFGVALDPDTQVLPTLGSKEAIFHMAQVLGGELVAVPAPAYPVYERGALFAGKGCWSCRCARTAASCPTSTPWPARTWRDVGAAVAQLPEQPDRRRPRRSRSTSGPRRSPASTASCVAADEAYSEIYFGAAARLGAPARRPDAASLAFNTLSKRSSMPGYRSGFVAGDPELIALLKRYRPNVGVAPPGVRPARGGRRLARRGARRGGPRTATGASATLLLPVLEARGLRNAGGDATFFLWLDAGPQAELLADRLLGEGIVARRRDRSSARPAPATCGSRSCRASPGASARPSGWTTCCAEPVCRLRGPAGRSGPGDRPQRPDERGCRSWPDDPPPASPRQPLGAADDRDRGEQQPAPIGPRELQPCRSTRRS